MAILSAIVATRGSRIETVGLDNELGRVIGQRRETSDDEKWTGDGNQTYRSDTHNPLKS